MDPSEQLTCPLCLDPYDCSARKPIDVGCGHSYCHECYDSGVSKGAFKECPECRRPSSNVHTNFSLLRALEATQEQQQLLHKQHLEIQGLQGLLAQLDIRRESARRADHETQPTERAKPAEAASAEAVEPGGMRDARNANSISKERAKREREEEDSRRLAMELQKEEEEAYLQSIGPQHMQGTQGKQEAKVCQGAQGVYTWRIPDFQQHLKTDKLSSEVFEIGAHKWRLLIFPKRFYGEYLSVYLEAPFMARKLGREAPAARFKFILVNQRDLLQSFSKETSHCFSEEKDSDWGYTYFISLDELKMPGSPFIAEDGSLELQVEIQEIPRPKGGEEESIRVALQLQKEEDEAYMQLASSKTKCTQDSSGPQAQQQLQQQQQQQQQQQCTQEKAQTQCRMEQLLSADRARVQSHLTADRAAREQTDPVRAQDASSSSQDKDQQERPAHERGAHEQEERVGSQGTRQVEQQQQQQQQHQQQQPCAGAQRQSAVVRMLQEQEEAQEPKDLPSLQSSLSASQAGRTFDLRGRELDGGLAGDLIPPPSTTIKNGTLLLQGSSCVRVAAENVRFEGLTLKGVGGQQPKVLGICNGGSLTMSSKCVVEGGLGWDGAAVIVEEGGSLNAQEECSMHSRCNGLLLRKGGHASLEGCRVCGNGRRGIYVADSGTTLHARRCNVDSNGGANLYVYRGSCVSLEHVSSNGSKSGHNWCVMGRGSSLSATHSSASSGNMCGAYVGLGGSATLTACKCNGNSDDGVCAEGSGSSLVMKASEAKGNAKRDVNECMGGRVCICADR